MDEHDKLANEIHNAVDKLNMWCRNAEAAGLIVTIGSLPHQTQSGGKAPILAVQVMRLLPTVKETAQKREQFMGGL